jgi:hypothetical protein
MDSPRTRRVQRVHLGQPVVARLGATHVVLVDISLMGARIEHHVPLAAGAHGRLAFEWQDETIDTDCRIVRSRLERFSVGADGLTIYHSGLEFVNMQPEARARLKTIIGRFITRALEEQKLNARGVIPHDIDRMPIFGFAGQLTADGKNKEIEGSALLPTVRIAAETGYLCYRLENGRWRHKRTHDPGQPMEGFTISATEDHAQVELLCDAYHRSDADGRHLIQLCAQLSILGDGVMPGRFDP